MIKVSGRTRLILLTVIFAPIISLAILIFIISTTFIRPVRVPSSTSHSIVVLRIDPRKSGPYLYLARRIFRSNFDSSLIFLENGRLKQYHVQTERYIPLTGDGEQAKDQLNYDESCPINDRYPYGDYEFVISPEKIGPCLDECMLWYCRLSIQKNNKELGQINRKKLLFAGFSKGYLYFISENGLEKVLIL